MQVNKGKVEISFYDSVLNEEQQTAITATLKILPLPLYRQWQIYHMKQEFMTETEREYILAQ